MSKQDPFRFNLRFDEGDEDHRKVCAFLNACGRKKARYIVKAFLAYWGVKGEASWKPEQETDTCMEKKESSDVPGEKEGEKRQDDHMVRIDAAGYSADDAEVSLMKKNYQMFDSLGEEM